MHKFSNDFYDEKLKIVLLGEIRQMTTFKNKSKLYTKKEKKKKTSFSNNSIVITWKKMILIIKT